MIKIKYIWCRIFNVGVMIMIGNKEYGFWLIRIEYLKMEEIL